jgi:hypothetical protein
VTVDIQCVEDLDLLDAKQTWTEEEIEQLFDLARIGLEYKKVLPNIQRVLEFEAGLGMGDTPVRLRRLLERLP